MGMSKLMKSLPFRLALGVAIGIIAGLIANESFMNLVVTLNYIFGQIISFCVPLIVIGFIAPSITKLGKNASRLLGVALTQLYMYIMENQKHIRALSESVQFMALRRQMGEKVYQYFYNHLERIGMFKNLTMPEAAMAVQIIIFSVMGVAFDAPFKDEADVKERVATFMSVIRKCTGCDPMQVR